MLRFTIITLLAISFMIAPGFAEIQLTEISSDIEDNINSIHMINSTHVWAAGDGGLLLSTDGISWTEETRLSEDNIQSVSFRDGNIGAIVGDSSFTYYTTNSGDDWTVSTLLNGASFNDVFFAPDSNTAFLVGSTGYLANSPNNGGLWLTITDVTREEITSVHSLSTMDWWFTTSSSIWFVEGVDWNEVEIPVANLSDVFFIDELNGIVLGSSAIYKTDDGGLIWNEATYPELEVDLNSVHFMDEHIGVIVGDEGNILYTEDGGNTWILETPVSNDLNDVFFIDEDNGFIVGDGGYLASFILGEVEDTTPPEIKLIGDNPLYVQPSEDTYSDDGATCTDDGIIITMDPPASNVNLAEPDTYFVTYSCTDKAENLTILNRVVYVDGDLPIVTLDDNTPYVLEVFEIYEETGVHCTDLTEAEIGDDDIIHDYGAIVNSILGEYNAYFDCHDSAGNIGSNNRLVNVTDTTIPVIELIGFDEITITQGESYTDLGGECDDNYDGEINGNLQYDDSIVKVDDIGTYNIHFTCADSSQNDAIPADRIVHVEAEDIVPPTLRLDDTTPYILEVFEEYDDLGAHCDDVFEGNIDERIHIDDTLLNNQLLGDYVITFTCDDTAGNIASPITRTISVEDNTIPEIFLIGFDPVTLTQGNGEAYQDSGADCTDNYDSTKSATYDDSHVSRLIAMTYTIQFNCSDSSGNPADTITREVIVVAANNPIITLNGDDPQLIKQFANYVELGAYCADSNNFNISERIEINNSTVNTNIPGDYTVDYDCADEFDNHANRVTRDVIVSNIIEKQPVSQIDVDLNDMSFINENHGWAVSDEFIYETEDGGNTWFEYALDRDSSNTMNAIHAVNENNIYIVDHFGEITYTLDGGTEWLTIELSDDSLNDIFFLGTLFGWIVGDNGVTYKSVDGGETWDDTFAPDTDSNLNTVFFYDVNNGAIVGDDGKLYLTLDGGLFWNFKYPGTEHMNSVSIIDEYVGVAVGANGAVTTLQTSENLRSYSLDSGDNLNDVFVIDMNNILIVGDNGIIYNIDVDLAGDGIKHSILISEYSLNSLVVTDTSILGASINSLEDNKILVVGDSGTVISLSLSPTGELSVNIPESNDDEEPEKKKSGGGCNDCTPPTIGLDKNFKRLVDYGFVYNGNKIQVEHFYTPYPLINATVGEINLVEIIAYENGGINNMKWVQFGLGAKEIGSALSTLEVLIEVHLVTDGTTEGVAVDEIVINDKNNLIENTTVEAVAYAVTCQDSDDTPNCVKVILQYSYREETYNHVMVVEVADKRHNSQVFYFNDGVMVLGESLNEPPTYLKYNKMNPQQTENIFLTLTRTDKINHLWEDKFGVQYLQISDDRFDRLTPHEKYSCANDKLVIKISAKRTNICQFLPLLNYEISRAEHVMNGIMASHNYKAIEQWDHNNKALRQYEAPQ